MSKYIGFFIKAFLWSCIFLVGWCLNKNIPSFFSSPYRTAIFLICITFITIGNYLDDKYKDSLYSRGMPDKTKEDLVNLAKNIIIIAICLISPFSDSISYLTLPEDNFIRILGLILNLACISMIFISSHYLGKHYSLYVTIPNDHNLVTRGIYRFIRHPRYLGIIMGAVGLALVFRSILGMAIAILIIPTILWRVKREENLLYEEYKDEWLDYKNKTKMFIPYLL